MIPDDIIDVAKKVRAAVVVWVSNDSEGIDTPSLRGACAIASYTLWLALKKLGKKADLVSAYDHCWVELPNLELVIDLTATQYNPKLDEVYIGPVKKHKHYNYLLADYRNQSAVKDLDDWWEPQQPSKFAEEISKFIDSI